VKKVNLDWSIGFWLGIFTISLINVALIFLNKNQLGYNSYIAVISFIVLIGFVFVLFKRKKKRR
jgi:LPXTG-motif cell wall-anchored protein